MTREEAKQLQPGDRVHDRGTGKKMRVLKVTRQSVHLDDDQLNIHIRKLKLAGLLRRSDD